MSNFMENMISIQRDAAQASISPKVEFREELNLPVSEFITALEIFSTPRASVMLLDSLRESMERPSLSKD